MEYIINSEQDGLLLRDFMRSTLCMSGGMIKRLKRKFDGITVNGIHQNVIYRLKCGDKVNFDICDTAADAKGKLLPVDLPLDILYEDENITVVNKPCNMPTHTSFDHYTDTLANALAYRYAGKPYIFRCTNRLDKDTSGVVLTANNAYFAAKLSKMISGGRIKKEYMAIVKGRIDGSGTIDAPIARVGDSIIKREVRDDGEYAVTDYRSIYSSDQISVVLAYPQTGRTHQLRVHFAYVGHPILGDELYGEKSSDISRQALHCYRMTLDAKKSFTACIPNDMKNVINRYFANAENLNNL